MQTIIRNYPHSSSISKDDSADYCYETDDVFCWKRFSRTVRSSFSCFSWGRGSAFILRTSITGMQYFLRRAEASLAGRLRRPCEMEAASMNWLSLNWRDGFASQNWFRSKSTPMSSEDQEPLLLGFSLGLSSLAGLFCITISWLFTGLFTGISLFSVILSFCSLALRAAMALYLCFMNTFLSCSESSCPFWVRRTLQSLTTLMMVCTKSSYVISLALVLRSSRLRTLLQAFTKRGTSLHSDRKRRRHSWVAGGCVLSALGGARGTEVVSSLRYGCWRGDWAGRVRLGEGEGRMGVECGSAGGGVGWLGG